MSVDSALIILVSAVSAYLHVVNGARKSRHMTHMIALGLFALRGKGRRCLKMLVCFPKFGLEQFRSNGFVKRNTPSNTVSVDDTVNFLHVRLRSETGMT